MTPVYLLASIVVMATAIASWLRVRSAPCVLFACALICANHYPLTSLALEYVNSPLHPALSGMEIWGRPMAVAFLVAAAASTVLRMGASRIGLHPAFSARGVVLPLLILHFVIWSSLLASTESIETTHAAQVGAGYLLQGVCILLLAWKFGTMDAAGAIVVAALAEIGLAAFQASFDLGRALPGGRLAGATPNAQLLGIVLVFGVASAGFVTAAAIERGNRAIALRWRFAMLVLTVGLFMTMSRGAIVCLVIVMLACLPRASAVRAWAVVILVAGAVFTSFASMTRLGSIDAGARLAAYAPAFEAIYEAPVLGRGNAEVQVESTVLTLAASGGVIALAPIVALLIASGFLLRLRSGRESRFGRAHFASLLLVLSLLVGFYENTWNAKIGFQVFVVWFACAALAVRSTHATGLASAPALR